MLSDAQTAMLEPLVEACRPTGKTVLIQLSDKNEIAPGEWFFEAGFGGLDGPDRPLFKDSDGAQAWIGQRLATQRAS